MTLSPALLEVEMTHFCPRCEHPIVKRGRWFATVSRFKCEGCGAECRLGYSDKLGLFVRYEPVSPTDSAYEDLSRGSV